MDNETLAGYAEYLMKTALKHCGNIVDAQDLVQETLLAALLLKENPENMKAWLLSVLKRKFYDLLRRKYKKPVVCIDFVADIPFEDENLLQIEHREEAAEIRRCVAQLALIYRDVLVRRYFKGESVKEIATALGISESAVKMRLFTGREHIRREYDMESYTNNSYEPEILRMGCAGSAGLDGEPCSLVESDDKIRQNLLILAYKKPLTITELSKAIGIAAAYVEPIVDGLVKNELMKRVSDKVYTDFIIYTNKDRLTGLETEKRLTDKLWRDIWEIIERELVEIRAEDCYKTMRRSQQLKLEIFYAVKALESAISNIEFSAAGISEEQWWNSIPDRPNGGKWYAFGNHGAADGFREYSYEEFGRYIIQNKCSFRLNDIGGLKELGIVGCETSLGGTYSAWRDSSIMCYPVYGGNACVEVMKILWAVHTNDMNMLSAIPHAFENLDGLEKSGFLTKNEQGDRIVDIPIITVEERGILEGVCEKYKNLLTEKYSDKIKALFANPVEIPSHLKSVPMWLRFMYCANIFVMRVIYNAVENKDFLPDYDKNTPYPAIMLFIKE